MLSSSSSSSPSKEHIHKEWEKNEAVNRDVHHLFFAAELVDVYVYALIKVAIN